jgi:hypothetical protein
MKTNKCSIIVLTIQSITVLLLSASTALATITPNVHIAYAVNTGATYVYTTTLLDDVEGGLQLTIGENAIDPPMAPVNLTATTMPIDNSASYLSGLFGSAIYWDLFTNAPTGISFWRYTGINNFDDVFDIDYSVGARIYNFTLLSSSNLINWSEVCTIVGWTGTDNNDNCSWICQVTYTNSTPCTTNWIKIQQLNEPTDLLVYGDIHTNICTQTSQFYRLSCNTNAVSNTGP